MLLIKNKLKFLKKDVDNVIQICYSKKVGCET
jgi:hypothetical protein